MEARQINADPIRVLLNYWEIPAQQIHSTLDRLLDQGISRVTSFVPWHVVESDISHSLNRFLIALTERRMQLTLIVTPELGVHLPASGLPKDFTTKPDHLAYHSKQSPILTSAPPKLFHLPSFFSSEVSHRYSTFLTRLDSALGGLEKNFPSIRSTLQLAIGGSFWKSYQPPFSDLKQPFSQESGDFSSAASVAYRKWLENHFSSGEWGALSVKTRLPEKVTRQWFSQYSENVFRGRGYQAFRRRCSDFDLSEIELFSPEFDPGLIYPLTLEAMGISADAEWFEIYSKYLDEASARKSWGADGIAHSVIRWSSLGPFHRLADAEKQFLILKSLLLLGSQGGGILIDEGVWSRLSSVFRARLHSISQRLADQSMRLRDEAYYLVPHLWSKSGALWSEISRRAGHHARLVTSAEVVLRAEDARLLISDPNVLMTRELLLKLLAWAKTGKIVALAESDSMTDSARQELKKQIPHQPSVQVDLGVPYRLCPIGRGQLVFYGHPEMLRMSGLNQIPALADWVGSVFSLAEVDGSCRVEDPRICAISMGGRDRTRSFPLFLLNGSKSKLHAEFKFKDPVVIEDLTMPSGQVDAASAAQKFALEIPAFGAFSLRVRPVAVRPQRKVELSRDSSAQQPGPSSAPRPEVLRREPLSPQSGVGLEA